MLRIYEGLKITLAMTGECAKARNGEQTEEDIFKRGM